MWPRRREQARVRRFCVASSLLEVGRNSQWELRAYVVPLKTERCNHYLKLVVVRPQIVSR